MRARGVGRASGTPIVDLGVLVPASMTEKRQVTSAPEVPGPIRSWNLARRSTCTMPVMTLMMMFSSHTPTLAEPLAPLALACAS